MTTHQNDALTIFFEKLKTLVPPEKLEEVMHDLSELFALNEQYARAAVEVEAAAPYHDPAGAGEISAFSGAAISLAPLDEEMRGRALAALQALLLPAPPTLAERLSPALVGFGEAFGRYLVDQQEAKAAEAERAPTPTGYEDAAKAMGRRTATVILGEAEQLVGTVVYENGQAWLSDGWNTKVEIKKEDLETYMAALQATRAKK